MKPFLKILFISAAAFSCCSVYAQKGNSEATVTGSVGPHFSFITKTSYDFGMIPLNSKASCQFEFKNTGNRQLVITDVHTSEKETNEPLCKIQIRYPKQPIKPGKRGNISIRFIAEDDIGSFKKAIYITSNATQDNSPLLLIQGAVTPIHNAAPVRQPDLREENEGTIPVYPVKK